MASAAHLQRILPDSVLVGGSASAVYAAHHLSTGADHVLTNLKLRFDQVLVDLESVAGWQTSRINRPVLILGSLDGIETGVRQLIRNEPLETAQIDYQGENITVPTEAEVLQIKGILILKRNATCDYLDFVALSEHMGSEKMIEGRCHYCRNGRDICGKTAVRMSLSPCLMRVKGKGMRLGGLCQHPRNGKTLWKAAW